MIPALTPDAPVFTGSGSYSLNCKYLSMKGDYKKQDRLRMAASVWAINHFYFFKSIYVFEFYLYFNRVPLCSVFPCFFFFFVLHYLLVQYAPTSIFFNVNRIREKGRQQFKTDKQGKARRQTKRKRDRENPTFVHARIDRGRLTLCY